MPEICCYSLGYFPEVAAGAPTGAATFLAGVKSRAAYAERELAVPFAVVVAGDDPRLITSQVDLGRLIAGHRESRGMTQDQLADAMRVSRTAIAHLEQGYRLPDGQVLARTCEGLGIPSVFWRGYQIQKLPAGLRARVLCTCFTYYTPSRSVSTQDEQARNQFVYAIKDNKTWRKDSQTTQDPYHATAKNLREKFPEHFLSKTFVPVPRSAMSGSYPEERWGPMLLARALAGVGDRCVVRPLVTRTQEIRSSSGCASHKRPTVEEHLRTLALTLEGPMPPGIVLVDDVVTLGTTMTACARILWEGGWPGEVEAVAAAYTRPPEEQQPPHEYTSWVYEWRGLEAFPRSIHFDSLDE